MEFNISALLDNLHEVDVDILPHTTASESRIKELTMKKLHERKSEQRTSRGMGFIGKLLVATLIIAVLAIPVMAVSGIQFTDWLEGLFTTEPGGYDNDLQLGSVSKNWEVSGWVVEISAEESSKNGLTFVCQEWGPSDKSGTLTSNEGYWLEKWNGTGYTPMEGAAPDGNLLTVSEGATQRWKINWEAVYGALDSGSYRIGKTFTYTAEDGNQEQLPFYAKFRVFTEDMAPLVEKYSQAYKALHDREVFHLSYTSYSYETATDPYSHHFTTQIWRNGNDFLRIVHYYNADGTLKSHGGTLFRDGVGYHLEWEDGDVNDRVTEWYHADYVGADSFDLWYDLMYVSPAIVVGACEDGNTLRFFEYLPYVDHDYIEKAYTFDDSGKLTNILYAHQKSMEPDESDPMLVMTLEVFDTPQESIAEIIEAQNVSDPAGFFWKDEQAQYESIAITGNLVNTEPCTMDSIQSVIDRARKEADPTAHPLYQDGYCYNRATVYYDPDTQMWKVQFTHSQDEAFVLLVYLNSDGTTRMLVRP